MAEKERDRSRNLPARRERPKGGWITNPIKSARHGKDGTISKARKAKQKGTNA